MAQRCIAPPLDTLELLADHTIVAQHRGGDRGEEVDKCQQVIILCKMGCFP